MVKVVAAQVGITVGGFNFEHTVAELQDGDIECTAAEVEDSHLHILVLLVQAVCQGSRGRLVHNTLNGKTCDLARLFGSLTLTVAEVCRNGNDSLADGLSQIIFGSLLHLLENHCRDLLRRIETVVYLDTRSVVVAALYCERHAVDFGLHLRIFLTHEPLDRVDGTLGVGDGLTLCRITYFTLTVVGECYDGRSGTLALTVDDDGGFVAFHHGNARVGSTKVNSYNLSHNCNIL